MGRGTALLCGLGAGVLTWTATEYAVHRWLMHDRHTANPITAEHLDHHRDLERTDPLRFDGFLWLPLAGGSLVGLATAPVAGGWAAAGVGAAFSACYCGYRHLHWAIHHRAPRTRWGRHLRRNHLRHHIGSPRRNHGVTTPLWDIALGSYRGDNGPVAVPAAMAPPWLRRPDGSIHPHLAGDYVLR